MALDRQRSKGFARDSVAQRAAGKVNQTQVELGGVRGEEARQQLVGIAETHMDIRAGVAAAQPFQGQLQGVEISRNRFARQRQGSDKVDAAGAAHVDLAFLFRVGVDQDLSLQPVRLQTEGAVHAGFFGHGEQHFQRAVGQAAVGQHRQRGRHTDAVVGAQRGAARLHPFAINIGLNRIFSEVMCGVVVFLRHHIEVRLQRHRRAVFHPGGCRFADQDIADRVALDPKTLLFRPADNIGGQRFFMKRGVRNGANFGEDIPQRLGRKLRQFRHDRSPVSVRRPGRCARVSSEWSPSANLT